MASHKAVLHDEIFRTLRDRIVHMEYPPGMALSEKELCAEFKVSRTPLREAIRKLEDMKLVSALPRYGTHVTQVDINEIRCAFEVKIKLEGLAGQLAAKRITANRLEDLKGLIEKANDLLMDGGHRALIEIDGIFHEIIREAAQNEILQDFLDNLHSRCARLWGSSLSEIIPTPEVIGQLGEIYHALKKRDGQRVAHLMELHVQYFIDKIKMQLL